MTKAITAIVLAIKAFYSYDETALILGVSRHTVAKWVATDQRLPRADQRLPGAINGRVPLKAIQHALGGMTVEEMRLLDVIAT
jgi:hypothetical protein